MNFYGDEETRFLPRRKILEFLKSFGIFDYHFCHLLFDILEFVSSNFYGWIQGTGCGMTDGQCPNPIGLTQQLRSLRTHWLNCLCFLWTWTVRVCNAVADNCCYMLVPLCRYVLSRSRKCWPQLSLSNSRHISLAHLLFVCPPNWWEIMDKVWCFWIYVSAHGIQC